MNSVTNINFSFVFFILLYPKVDKGDVTHFVANVVEDEQVDFAKLRQMLQDQEKRGSSSIDASNILGDVCD